MTTLYRLASLRGARLRNSEGICVSETATRGSLETAKITGACLPFLMHLVRQHAVAVLGAAAGAADVDAAVARLASELGKLMPELQKHVKAKWRPFGDVQEQMQYQKIAVKGKVAQGKELGYFNKGRQSKVSKDSLRTAVVVTPDLFALLKYLGHDAAVGSPMPTLMKEAEDGWVPLKESARSGDNMVATAGTGERKQHTFWYLSWPGRW
jgi:hypothetical protein